MKSGLGRRLEGFTLLEVMIIVALIGLLSVLAIPSYVRVRKQTQGKRIVNDARNIDSAIDAWAMENNRSDGDALDLVGVSSYSKSGPIRAVYILGNAFGLGPVGTNQVRIASQTKSALSAVQIDWGAY